MRCLKCGTENLADAAFCEQCGNKLEALCPSCNAPVSVGARFCRKCGAAIASAATPAVKPDQPKPPAPIRASDTSSGIDIEGERKTVTALFADIKGSTELMQDLDPEEARAIIDPALTLMMDAVH